MSQADNLAALGSNVNASGVLQPASGGTGATSNAAAPFATKGANSDITSLSGLTTPLSVAQGGIGVATLTANNVLLGNGTSALQAVAPGSNGNVLTSNGTTWTSTAPSSSYVGDRAQIFTSSGTFTVPTGITAVKVTVVGGGGSGAAAYTNGVAGGTTTFGAHASAGGGGGGGVGGASGSGTPGAGGTATTGDFLYTGGAGGTSLANGGNSNGGAAGNAINNDWFGGNNYRIPGMFGGLPGVGTTSSSASTNGSGYGNGGGAIGNNADRTGAGGGGGSVAIKWVTGLTPGGTVTVTIGAYGTSQGGSLGTAGLCIVEYQYDNTKLFNG